MDKPIRKKFGSRHSGTQLSAEAAQRQGLVANLAWNAFRDSDAVKAFLNTHDDVMGGRPIDIAIADDSGLAIVTSALAGREPAAPRVDAD